MNTLQRELQSLQNLFEAGFLQAGEYEERKATLTNPNNLALASIFETNDASLALSSDEIGNSETSFVFSGYDVRPQRQNIEKRARLNTKAKKIRIFVSSTFLDMKEERTLLIQTVFPELKRICALRNIPLVYVDFRWGITAEDSAGGRVIQLCLDEIDNCRPYVIGILGERYGWCKSGLDKVLDESFQLAAPKHPWLEKYTDRSVTELELLYSALFYPDLAPSTFIYLRDPKYVETNTAMKEAPNSMEAKKLADLKKRIKASGIQVKENYRNPQEFADAVLADLAKRIEQDFPLETAKTQSVTEREEALMRDFAKERTLTYITRPTDDSIISHFVQDKTTTPLLIFGDRGSGKTSLICKWMTSHSKSDIPIIPCFIGLIHFRAHKNMHYILSSLKAKFNIDKDLPNDPSELLHSLSEWLLIVASKGKCVLILEGIDRMEVESLAWLPKKFPPQIRVIITCGVEHQKSFDFLTSSALNWDHRLNVAPLSDVEKRGLIERYLTVYGKKLSFSQIQSFLQQNMSSNPLYLSGILHQMVMFADFNHLSQYIDELLFNKSLGQLYDFILADIEKSQKSNFVRDVLCFIHVSRNGLVEAELVALLEVYQQSAWSSLFALLGDLVNHSTGLITFSNAEIRNAVERRYLNGKPNAKQYYQGKIVSFFASKTNLTDRKLYEYPYHLHALKQHSEMQSFLTGDINVLTRLYNSFSKFDLFSYLKGIGASSSIAGQFADTLNRHRSRVNDKEFAELQFKVANFMVEYGDSTSAVPLFQGALNTFSSYYGANSDQVAEVSYEYARLLVAQVKFTEANEMIQKARKIRESLYGYESSKVADCIWLTALIFKKQGHYDQAIQHYQSALNIAQNLFGPNHPHTATYLKTIADVYRLQSNYGKAQAQYVEALRINRFNFGNMHPGVSECLDSLGRIYKKEGKYHEAKELYTEALEIQITLYGKEHVSVGETCSNLADVERKLNNYKVAEELYLEALKIMERSYGKNHPEYAEVCNSIGILYKVMGKMDEALQIIESGLKAIEAAFDRNHIKNARFLNNMADIHAICARYTIAKELYIRAMQINSQHLGADHPEVSENLNSIGKIEKKRGNYREAQKCYERSLHIVKKVYGEDHPKVALYLHDLATVYRKTKVFDKAWEAYTKAKEMNAAHFGEDSPEVAQNLNGMGMILKTKGEDLDQAALFHQTALDTFTRVLGGRHERVAQTLNLLAEVHRKQGKFTYDGAEAEYLRCLEINKEFFGDEHPEIAENLNGLAQVYKGQLNYPKAEPVLKEAIAMSIRTLGETHPHVINRKKNLADLYEKMGRVDDSIKMWAEVERLRALRQAEEAQMMNEKVKL